MKVYARVLDGQRETSNCKIDGTLNELTDSARQVPDVDQLRPVDRDNNRRSVPVSGGRVLPPKTDQRWSEPISRLRPAPV
ncbi:hypothetical protein [Lentzea albida]|uniref:hypothetical protein n=1 Tax=Lentzea albida TaxID=65499 RepID=UPI0011600E70|nr:hypothetical protein [Lentzea albida]